MASNNAVFNGVSEGFSDMLADFVPLAEWVESQKTTCARSPPPSLRVVFACLNPPRKRQNNTQYMGLLSLGTPLAWDECKKYAEHVRYHGITQLLHIWDHLKSRSGDKLLWGDEVRRDRVP